MQVKAITPILNVSDIETSLAWFETLGWAIGFKWGEPTGFASVCSGNCEIFLCLDGQGGRGRGSLNATFGSREAEQSDKGVWMSLWVDDVDAFYQHCLEHRMDITFTPTDMPWNVREMHLRHPDGHVFRVGTSTAEDDD